MPEYKYVSKQNVSGKTVLVRVELNSNVEGGELFPSARIRGHAKTLKELSEKGAKLVVLAHQGRKGQEDCISLKQHAEEISEQIGKEVKLLPWDSDYVSEIKQMQPGEIILMENVRFHENEEQDFSPEEAAKVEWVQRIASAADLFALNALSVCHRKQPSVVGFPPLLPSFIGPALERELKALAQYDKSEKPVVFLLGGVKIDDTIELMQTVLASGKADIVCTGGLLGELFLKATGKSLGEKEKFFEEKNLNGLVEPAKQLLASYSEKIVLPADVAVLGDDDGREEIGVEELPTDYLVCDIGSETISLFKQKMRYAKLIVMIGPLGIFERPGFEPGTKRIFAAISKSKAFSLIGGGDTEAAMEQLDFSAKDFGHVSLAGKALLQYLVGEQLPGLLALQK